jgi:biopolymer transport protein ExbB
MQGKWFHRIVAAMLFASLLTLVAGVGRAGAWWDGKWKYRKKIVLDTTAEGADIKEALTDFPVLLRLHSGNFTFANAKSDGSDIRFVGSDDKTPLKYHIEKYDPAAEMVLVWVKLPRLPSASNQDFIWVYYGNGKVSSGGDPGGTYDTAQVAVYHLDEKEGSPRDTTAYGNHGKEFTGKLGTPGAIGTGITFKGEGDRLVIAKSPSLNFSKGFTFSAWVRMSRPQQDGRLFSWDDGKQSVVVAVEGTKLSCALSEQKKKTVTDKTVDLPLSRWVHVAVTWDAAKGVTIFTDGRERLSQKHGAAFPEPAADISFGASIERMHSFAGDVDEIGLSAVSRSPAWVRAAAVDQGPETPLLSYLEEEGSSGGGESLTIHLLVVTARAITLDGWIIIGVIVVMIALTWIVFFNKFIGLRRLKRDNAAFADAFGASDDVRAAEEVEGLADSSLLRVYGAGLEELDRGLDRMGGSGKKKIGPAQIITAFKAALDRAAMQESKRNTAGLLLFTLSISGGPFMGLFGTVWGVINTFAGVAEAGEANLAAIAPGVASALACTLMGLLLAIPALFQYSYLSAEIKAITADMNLFLGDFLNRVEEEYGGKG